MSRNLCFATESLRLGGTSGSTPLLKQGDPNLLLLMPEQSCTLAFLAHLVLSYRVLHKSVSSFAGVSKSTVPFGSPAPVGPPPPGAQQFSQTSFQNGSGTPGQQPHRWLKGPTPDTWAVWPLLPLCEGGRNGKGRKQGQVKAAEKNLCKKVVQGDSQALLHNICVAGKYESIFEWKCSSFI